MPGPGDTVMHKAHSQGHLWPGWPQTLIKKARVGGQERDQRRQEPPARDTVGDSCRQEPPLMSHVTWSPNCGSSTPLPRSAYRQTPKFPLCCVLGHPVSWLPPFSSSDKHL